MNHHKLLQQTIGTTLIILFLYGCSTSPPTATFTPMTENIARRLQGDDPVAKTKAILELQMLDEADLVLLVPFLISALNDETSVIIPENLIGADVMLNTQFAPGSELRFNEGDVFPSDDGIVIAGKDARLRVSAPAHEASAMLKKITGEDFGLDSDKWGAWWNEQQ